MRGRGANAGCFGRRQVFGRKMGAEIFRDRRVWRVFEGRGVGGQVEGLELGSIGPRFADFKKLTRGDLRFASSLIGFVFAGVGGAFISIILL